ncbi:hypothetical protein DUE52_20920 [Larkinella punicea]|uniref:Uncharacterized protein n=1 Tax=Larkinella punicea TaxID=2315727 RepID=A0A368JIT4_9BACT|nr:hypothetical protein DUE52_20920 [Larkinella punicea]
MPTTDNPAQDACVLERTVGFNDYDKRSIARIDLYKRGCFGLESKRGTESPDQHFPKKAVLLVRKCLKHRKPDRIIVFRPFFSSLNP